MPCRTQNGKQICTRTDWWRDSMGIDWYSGSGGSQPPAFDATVLTVDDIGDETADLSWVDVSADNYVLQRATLSDYSDAVEIYSGTDLDFQDTVLTPETTYYWRVKAQKAGFSDSAFSNASAKTSILLIFDDFERANGDLNADMPTIGSDAWQGPKVGTSIISVESNVIRQTSAGASSRYIIAGVENVDMRVTLPIASLGARLILRINEGFSEQTFLIINLSSCAINQVIETVVTNLHIGSGASVNGDTIRVTCLDNIVKVYRNATLVAETDEFDFETINGSFVGVQFLNDTTGTMNDFYVYRFFFDHIDLNDNFLVTKSGENITTKEDKLITTYG